MINRYLESEIEEIEEMEQEEKQAFKVTDMSSATWCFRKLKALQSKIDEVNSIAEAEMQRIQMWKDSQINSHKSSMEYFEYLLIDYFKENKAKDDKFKSVNTPYGKVTSRKQQPKYIYQDEEKILQCLKDLSHTDCIKTVENIDKETLKKKFGVVNGCLTDSDGCIIDGISVEEQPVKISVKLS